MRFGYQTIIWGAYPVEWPRDESHPRCKSRRESFIRMLDIIADAGFEGVEFFQRPDELPPYATLMELLKARQLTLLGLAEGPLKDRVAYLGEDKRPYLYLDRKVDSETRKYLDDGWRIAIHPHHWGEIETLEEAAAQLEGHANLCLIPDTAHAAIKHEGIEFAIREHKKRLAAIHIKDWRPGFGRISSMYERGFTELGAGRVDIGKTLRQVKKELPEDTWVVVEQDYASGLIEDSVQRSSRWLQEQGYLKPRVFNLEAAPQISDQPEQDWARKISFATHRLVSSDLVQLYDRVAEGVREAFDVWAAVVWSRSPRDNQLTLQAVAGGESPPSEEDMLLCDAWTETVSTWQPAANVPVRPSVIPPSLGRLRLALRSTWNPHVVHMVVDLFNEDPLEIRDGRRFLERTLGRAFDLQLDEIMMANAAWVNEISSDAEHLDTFTREFRELVRQCLGCESVAIFLTDSTTKLSPTPDTRDALEWDCPQAERFYTTNDRHPTTEAWQRAKPMLTNRYGAAGRKGKSKSWMKDTKFTPTRVLYMPIVSIHDPGGATLGLIRCNNKLTLAADEGAKIRNFSEDDLAVLDHLLQTAIPAILMRQREAAQRMKILMASHEFKRPVTSIRGTLDGLARRLERLQFSIPEYDRFSRDIEHLTAFSNLLYALVMRSWYYAGSRANTQNPRIKKTLLMGDLLAGAVEQVRIELKERRLSSDKILYEKEESREIPALYVDPDMFQQVFFNLLDNAVKYAKRDSSDDHRIDPEQFMIDIVMEVQPNHYVIHFRDQGIGVAEGLALFDLGVRGSETFYSEAGSGLGLPIVKNLLGLHGARIELTSNARESEYTEFTIWLPKELADPAWKGRHANSLY